MDKKQEAIRKMLVDVIERIGIRNQLSFKSLPFPFTGSFPMDEKTRERYRDLCAEELGVVLKELAE